MAEQSVEQLDRCEVCQAKIHAESTYVGHERWCEECFERGLSKDMNDHFLYTMIKESEGNK